MGIDEDDVVVIQVVKTMKCNVSMEENITAMVMEKMNFTHPDEVSSGKPLADLGLSEIDIYDLIVHLEDMYDITLDNSAGEVGGYSVDALSQNVKGKLIRKPQEVPNWKDSFEGLVFNGITKKLRTPMSVHLDLTFRCNMKCVFCYDSAGPDRSKHEMSIEKVYEIIDECKKLDVIDVTFGGGEPFIRKDLIDVITYTKRKNIRYFIITNGTLITEEIAFKLARVFDHRYDKIQVSLDGPTAEVHDRQRGVIGGFDLTMKGIDNLQKAGISPTINAVLTSNNYPHIKDMIPFLMDRGISNFRVLRLHPLGRGKDPEFYKKWNVTPEQSEELFEYLMGKQQELIDRFAISNDFASIFPWSAAKFRNDLQSLPGVEPVSYACGAGTTKIAIGPEGDVYPCSYMYDFPELKIGSIQNGTIQELWEREKLWDMYREPLTPSGKCGKCDYLYCCKTGCRIVSYALFGDMAGPDAGCTYEPGLKE
ncbi:MAG: radical SAM protein [Desulfobulbaceae bacterium]|nr:radical SAM protein [Desulfobulbaceae bacterium]